ncbi:MAG: CAP domain-containing protein [Pyrinomonadaceae bacterium]
MSSFCPNLLGRSVNARSICFKSALLTLVIFLCCQWALAQVSAPQPVARLIAASPAYPKLAETPNETTFHPTFAEATAIERRAFDETNNVRKKNGLEPLSWDPELCRMARQHSENMGRQQFFSHVEPQGTTLPQRAKLIGIVHFSLLAENIAYNQGYDDPGGFAVQRWMASSGHRANILYGGFQSSAIGVFVAADGSVYLTQVFLTR